MGKYSHLEERLRLGDGPVTLNFEAIAGLVGGLPDSAYRYREWWANPSDPENDRHVQARAWLGAGRLVEAVDLQNRWVRFSARE